jgi:hypothetical protein
MKQTLFFLQDYLGGNSKDITKADFVAFMKKAAQKGTPEYRQLYFFLLKCFQAGDVHHVCTYINICRYIWT